MLPVPDNILKEFETVLEKKGIAKKLRPDFKKWLRYFLDFSAKYPLPEAHAEQVRLFIDTLREKRPLFRHWVNGLASAIKTTLHVR